jgi:hypothetical protein
LIHGGWLSRLATTSRPLHDAGEFVAAGHDLFDRDAEVPGERDRCGG